jgi:hypothetical protein
MRNNQKKVEHEMRESQLTANAFEMGFERQLIKFAYKRRFESHTSTFESFEQLVDAIHSIKGPINSSDDFNFYDKSTKNVMSPLTTSNSNPSEMLKKLEMAKRCKICHTKDVNILFLPCGHLASCSECSAKTNICCICRTTIKQKVQTFRS